MTGSGKLWENDMQNDRKNISHKYNISLKTFNKEYRMSCVRIVLFKKILGKYLYIF